MGFCLPNIPPMTIPSFARIPTHVPALLIASMAYSTWKRRPSGEKMVVRESYRRDMPGNWAARGLAAKGVGWGGMGRGSHREGGLGPRASSVGVARAVVAALTQLPEPIVREIASGTSRIAHRYQRRADVVCRGYSGYNSRWVRQVVPSVVDQPEGGTVTRLLVNAGDSVDGDDLLAVIS